MKIRSSSELDPTWGNLVLEAALRARDEVLDGSALAPRRLVSATVALRRCVREGLGRGLLDRANLTGLVLGCIKAKVCKKICV